MTRARNSPRRSGWILRRQEAPRRPWQLSRCRAPTLLPAGSRSRPDPAGPQPPARARTEEAPTATLLFPGTPAQDTCLGAKGNPGFWRGAPGASWRPLPGARAQDGAEGAPGWGQNCSRSPGPGLRRNKRKMRVEGSWVGWGSGVGSPGRSGAGLEPPLPLSRGTQAQGARWPGRGAAMSLGLYFSSPTSVSPLPPTASSAR